MSRGSNLQLALMCMQRPKNRRKGFRPAGSSPDDSELSEPGGAGASITEQYVCNPVIMLIRPENHGVGKRCHGVAATGGP